MTLTAHFWGTRGSVPSPGPATVRYGGNTPCVELRTQGGTVVILDAGTGIRPLGNALLAEAGVAGRVEADVFLTHLHWDHIQGLPFFAPLFQAGSRVTVHTAATAVADAERVLHAQMATKVFPVTFAEVAAAVEFRALATGGCTRNGYTVRAHPVRHPGGALGLRFAEAGGGALVYVPDNELDPTVPYDAARGWREDLIDFVRGARVLVHDSMYTAAEYVHHRGWGHSTYADALALALDAEVETLVLFHHDPDRTDDGVDAALADCRATVTRRGRALNVIAAAEGLRLDV